MEKGMSKRGSVRGDENVNVDRPSVAQLTNKVPDKSVVRDQLVVDGRLSSDESAALEGEGSVGKAKITDAESDSSSRASLKRRSSASSTNSTSTTGSKRRKGRSVVFKSKSKKKDRKPIDPFYSYDARDTEMRENKMGENVDSTVGLLADGTYEVEKIIKRKFQDDEFLYLVQWKGWKGYDSWEPMSNLNGCKSILRRFYSIDKEEQLERMRSIANNVSQLMALSGKYALHERDVICSMTEQDYRSIYKLPEYEQPLPNVKLLCSHINKIQKESDKDLEAKVKKMVMQREVVRLRYEQALELKEFVDNLNKTNEKELLFMENESDLGGPPINFKIIKENEPLDSETVKVLIPTDPPVWCECNGCNEDMDTCDAALAEFDFAYAHKVVSGKKEKLLQLEHGKPVYECNKRCKCPSTCLNRVLQNGSTIKLKIFKTKNMGWGVTTMEPIPQGKFVCEYIGEVITSAIADDRGKTSTYIFALDFNPLEDGYDQDKLPYSIDAAQHGNISHFINHSCDPNLGVYAVYVDCLDPALPRLGLYAIRDIKAGEQIFFDYSAEYHRRARIKPKKAAKNENVCQCGAITCRQIEF